MNVYLMALIILVTLMLIYSPSLVHAAMGGDNDSNNKVNLYKEAKDLVLRAKKLEKKNKTDKALKLYSKAYKKLFKAY